MAGGMVILRLQRLFYYMNDYYKAQKRTRLRACHLVQAFGFNKKLEIDL